MRLTWKEPVSYTHLDVYKRQGMGLVNEVFTPDILEPMKGDIGAVSYTHLWVQELS